MESQAAPSGLQMTPPSLPDTENPGMPGSPDFILIIILYSYALGKLLLWYVLKPQCRVNLSHVGKQYLTFCKAKLM